MGKKWSIKISQTSPAANQQADVPAPQPKPQQPPADTNVDEVEKLLKDPNAVLPIGEGDTQIFRLLSGEEVSTLIKFNLTTEKIFDAIEASLNRQGFNNNANYSQEQLQAFQNRMDSDLKEQYGEVLNFLNKDLFNQKYAHITSLSEEIKFYEDRKLFKLADQVTTQLTKLALTFDADTNLGYKGVNDRLEDELRRYACKLPECQEFCKSGSFNMTGDYQDSMNNATNNKKQSTMDANMQWAAQSSKILGDINITPDRKAKIDLCYQAVRQRSQLDSQNKATITEGVSVMPQAAQSSREYPPKI